MPMNGEIFFTCGRSATVEGIWLFAARRASRQDPVADARRIERRHVPQ